MTKNILLKMIEFSEGNTHDIDHFLKVTAYAKLIADLENLDSGTKLIVELTAIVHDIACPLCRVKYGNTSGKNQEIESEALLREFFREFSLPADVLERIIHIVSHHHTYEGIDGVDYQILIEADYLVNAAESAYGRENIECFCDNIAKQLQEKSCLEKYI